MCCVKSDGAKSLLACRWLEEQGLRYQMVTYKSKHSPTEAASDAFTFMQEIRKKVKEASHKKIYDQHGSNPCLLCLLETKGIKTVIIHTLTESMRWATLALTVYTYGTKLLPLFIFKDKQKVVLLKKGFQLFHPL